ncbi:MAG TPA: glycosyltransferase [Cyclobacteriaceae bacterium]|nr:glycosyltransferase [Cyclobacteriaceae bacterium]
MQKVEEMQSGLLKPPSSPILYQRAPQKLQPKLKNGATDVDIIILTLSRWDGPYSSTGFSMAKELSKTHRVFYIDNPFTIKDFIFDLGGYQIRKRLKKFLLGKNVYHDLSTAERKLIALTTSLELPINFLPDGLVYDLLLKVNDWIFFKAVKELMDRYQINNFIFINVFNPFYGIQFPDFFQPKCYVYYTNDDIGNSLYVQKHGVCLESKAFREASLVFATSHELKKKALEHAERVHYLPNGVDQSLFFNRHVSRPIEFRSIQNPIIIFTGNCDHRLDYGLVRSILRRHPDKTLVMIGPIQGEEADLDELKTYPNIKFFGRRDLAELPKYLHFASCAIIPYKCNALTRSIYPLKLNEYLASGTPVVATPFSEDIKKFDGIVLIGESDGEFCDKITEAIANDSEEKKRERISHAMKNNWQNRVNEFWDVVQHHMDTTPTR